MHSVCKILEILAQYENIMEILKNILFIIGHLEKYFLKNINIIIFYAAL
jgi:hypothetical protein